MFLGQGLGVQGLGFIRRNKSGGEWNKKKITNG
jgi:hypothetical protein